MNKKTILQLNLILSFINRFNSDPDLERSYFISSLINHKDYDCTGTYIYPQKSNIYSYVYEIVLDKIRFQLEINTETKLIKLLNVTKDE